MKIEAGILCSFHLNFKPRDNSWFDLYIYILLNKNITCMKNSQCILNINWADRERPILYRHRPHRVLGHMLLRIRPFLSFLSVSFRFRLFCRTRKEEKEDAVSKMHKCYSSFECISILFTIFKPSFILFSLFSSEEKNRSDI